MLLLFLWCAGDNINNNMMNNIGVSAFYIEDQQVLHALFIFRDRCQVYMYTGVVIYVIFNLKIVALIWNYSDNDVS